jgi:hypothetical protein
MSAVPSSFTATSLDRRIQMLRTAMGPLIAAALEDPDVVEIMLNPTARSGWIGCPRAARRWAWSCPRPMANASSASWPPTSARKCIAASRC